MLSWLVWEFAVLAAALRVAWLFGWRRGAGEMLLAVAALDVTIGSCAAAALTFSGLNSPAAYLVVALGLLLAGAGREPWASLLRTSGTADRSVLPALLLAPFVPALLLAWRPVQDVDSLNYLHYLLEYAANRLTPFRFFYNYVPFWELNFLPGLVLTRGDLVFGLIAVKALVVLGAALHLAGRELGLSGRLLALLVASALSFRYLWWEHSGVATMKNDTLYAGGLVLLAVALLRAHRRPGEAADDVLLALGAVFACVKYSGPLLAGPALAAYWLIRRPRVRSMLAALALVTLCCGIYYLRTAWQTGNPFYPYQINLGPLHLPGTADLSNTSILRSLHDARVWKYLFLPADGLSPAGLLFPAVLAIALPVAFLLECLSLARLARRREIPGPRAVLAMFLLAGWWVYFRSFYSASGEPGDLAYLFNDLVSLRYAEAQLMLSELLLASLLAPLAGPAVTGGLAAVQWASRLWLIYRHVPLDVFPSRLILTASAAAACLLLGVWAVRDRRWRAGLLVAFAAAGIAAAPWVTERNRAHWMDDWKGCYAPFREAPPSSIFIPRTPDSGYEAPHFPFAGRRLQHTVVLGEEDGLDALHARYVVRLAGPGGRRAGDWSLARRLEKQGYVPVIAGACGMVLERGAAGQPGMRGSVWLLPLDGLPAAGQTVDGGARKLQQGEFALSASTGELFRVGTNETVVVRPLEGAQITLADRGPRYNFQGGVWRPDAAGLRFLTPDSNLAEAFRNHSLQGLYTSMAPGEASIEYLADSTGPFLRVRAPNASKWLLLAGSLPALPDGAPVTIRAEVRCPSAGACRLNVLRGDFKEVLGRRAGEWETLEIPLRLPAKPEGGHFSAGLSDVEAGDSFDIRALGVAEGIAPTIRAWYTEKP
jgi:hypothetical protein